MYLSIYILKMWVLLNMGGLQNQWRFCSKCNGLFFVGRGDNGVCPAGGGHDPSQSGDYALLDNIGM